MSESGRFRQGAGSHLEGDGRRRVLMLTLSPSDPGTASFWAAVATAWSVTRSEEI